MNQEKIDSINQTIDQLDKVIELRRLQVIEIHRLKHSLIQQLRALNPVFWLEGKKHNELKVLYKDEQDLRTKCGLEPVLDLLPLKQNSEGICAMEKWVTIERSKWNKNKLNLKSGMMLT